MGSQLLWQVLCSHVCYSGRICVASRMRVIFIQCRDSVPWLPCPRCALPQLLLLAVTQRPCPWTCFQVEGSVTWEPVRNTGGFSLKCFWERREDVGYFQCMLGWGRGRTHTRGRLVGLVSEIPGSSGTEGVVLCRWAFGFTVLCPHSANDFCLRPGELASKGRRCRLRAAADKVASNSF